MNSRYFFIVTILLSMLVGTEKSSALDLYEGAKPQSTSNTCQSYATVLALAAIGDPAFRFENFDDIRSGEQNFRSILDAMSRPNPYLHTNWPKAMEQFTGGKYTVDLTYTDNDIVDWLSLVRSNTTINDDFSAILAELNGENFQTVLTSVTELGDSSYSKGHIVTVTGVLGSGIDSNTKIVAFNSAIKGKGGTVTSCSTENQPGDEAYKAGIVETEKYQLRQFELSGQKKFLFMRVVAK